MVEGPGCKLKGEKLKAAASGQVVKKVSGSAVDNARPGPNRNAFLDLVGRTVTDVRTLGKELFLIFNHSLCVRVHFLMEGFVRYNHSAPGNDENTNTKNKDPEAVKPRLELQLTKDLVGFYSCSADLRDTNECVTKWENMIRLDICWPSFDSVRAFSIMREKRQEERLVCDVLMDQDILPGVGNIIKNEACFEAAVNPLSKMRELSDSLVKHLVKMTRDFSAIFYECRRTGKPLSKYYKMYRFSVCKQCLGKVTKCHPGEYQRGTYFCPKCQDNRALEEVRPCKNSLLGWARPGGGGGAILQASTWSCSACTLENKPGSSTCAACGQQKNKRKSEDSHSKFSFGKKSRPLGSNLVTNNSGTVGSQSIGTQNHSSTLNMNSNNSELGGKWKVAPGGELCKGHKKPCVKKTVSKEGPNKLRQFYACPFEKQKSCGHFAWADLHHPKCKHGVITILREVYKLNENNGREFFICPKSKKEQCDFFKWND